MVVCCRPLSSVVIHRRPWLSVVVVCHPLSLSVVVCGRPSSVVRHHLSSVVRRLWLTVVCGRLSSLVDRRLWSTVDHHLLSTVDRRLWSPCRSLSSIVCDHPSSVIVASSSRRSVVGSSVVIARQSSLSRCWLVGQSVVGGHRWSSVVVSRPQSLLVVVHIVVLLPYLEKG